MLSGVLGKGALPELQVLNLGQNLLGDEGVKHLSKAMARDGVLDRLKKLGLNQVCMGTGHGAEVLMDMMMGGHAKCLRSIDLKCNRIIDSVRLKIKACELAMVHVTVEIDDPDGDQGYYHPGIESGDNDDEDNEGGGDDDGSAEGGGGQEGVGVDHEKGNDGDDFDHHHIHE